MTHEPAAERRKSLGWRKTRKRKRPDRSFQRQLAFDHQRERELENAISKRMFPPKPALRKFRPFEAKTLADESRLCKARLYSAKREVRAKARYAEREGIPITPWMSAPLRRIYEQALYEPPKPPRWNDDD